MAADAAARSTNGASLLKGSAALPGRTTVVVLLAYVVVWVGLDFAAAQVEVTDGVSLWYPPAALDVALLLVLGLRWAPALLVTATIHSYLVTSAGLQWWQVAILAVATAASYAGGAALLHHRLDFDRRLPTLRDVVSLGVVMCLAAPVPTAIARVSLLAGAGAVDPKNFLLGVGGFWAGSATGIAMLAPLLLVWARRWPRYAGAEPDLPGQPVASRSRLEIAGQALLLALTVWVPFAASGGSLDYGYLIYAPLIWIALRGGFVPAALAVLATNIGAVALNGGAVPEEGGLALQFGLVVLSLLGVLLGAAVTQRQADAEASRRASLEDPLTGLANRTLLADRISHALARRPAPNDAAGGITAGGALLFLDLDRFKEVNDSLGHGIGDLVLIELSRRLREVTREADTVARLGGDEFAVLLDDVGEADVESSARRILAAVSEPIETPHGAVHLTMSIGSAALRDDANGLPSRDVEEVLQHADVALHDAKAGGRNRHVPFDTEMRERAIARRSLAVALREALDDDEITVAFQPIVAVPERRVLGAEALARWTLADGTQVPPQEFIAVAESNGLIGRLGLSVLRQACTAASGWLAAPSSLRVAVNVSALELRDPNYADNLLAVLAETGLAPDRLELEITETQWVAQVASTTRTLTRITEAGVRLVLDDFGTGYSSFSYLATMPVAGLKIDRTFLASIATDEASADLVRAVLCLAYELDLEVTAEGVETERQWNFLAEHDCARAQGYLLGHPQPKGPTLA